MSYKALLDFESAFGTPDTCPGCGDRALSPIGEGGTTSFHCTACETDWRFDFGRLARVSKPGARRTEEPSPCGSD